MNFQEKCTHDKTWYCVGSYVQVVLEWSIMEYHAVSRGIVELHHGSVCKNQQSSQWWICKNWQQRQQDTNAHKHLKFLTCTRPPTLSKSISVYIRTNWLILGRHILLRKRLFESHMSCKECMCWSLVGVGIDSRHSHGHWSNAVEMLAAFYVELVLQPTRDTIFNFFPHDSPNICNIHLSFTCYFEKMTKFITFLRTETPRVSPRF